MVPNGWEVKSFEDIAFVGNGQVDPRQEPYSSMRHIGPENVTSDTGRIKNIRRCSELGLISGKYEFDKNSIVYSKIRPNLNKVCRPNFDGVCSADMYPIWTKEGLYADYLFYYMLGPKFYSTAVSMSMRTGMPKINRTDLDTIKINIPPINEQQKIAKILSTWDKAISATERLIDNSTQQKKALMQQLLTGKKRLLDGSGKRFEGKWEEVKLSKWLVEYKEKSTIQDQYDVYTSSRNGLILQSDYFANSRIADRNNIGFHVMPPNHITYRSRSDDGFFTFNLFSSDAKGLISNYYPVFSTKGSNVFFIALFEQYRATFGRYSVGTSQKVLSLNALKDISFKIPSIPEQQKIATVLTNADKEIELLEQQLAGLQQEKKALMQVLLTGNVRVLVDE